MISDILPENMTYEQVADLFMSTMAGQFSGLNRAEFIAVLRQKYADLQALNAAMGGIRKKAQGMFDVGAFSSPGQGSGYTLPNDGMAIRCGACGTTSWNASDVANLYCGYCKQFHAY